MVLTINSADWVMTWSRRQLLCGVQPKASSRTSHKGETVFDLTSILPAMPADLKISHRLSFCIPRLEIGPIRRCPTFNSLEGSAVAFWRTLKTDTLSFHWRNSENRAIYSDARMSISGPSVACAPGVDGQQQHCWPRRFLLAVWQLHSLRFALQIEHLWMKPCSHCCVVLSDCSAIWRTFS